MTQEELQKENEFLKKRLDWYEKDASYRGFYALNKIVNQQIDFLNGFVLKNEIGQSPKDDKTYDRTQALWKELPNLISDLDTLKTNLKITGDEDKDSRRLPFNATLAEKRN